MTLLEQVTITEFRSSIMLDSPTQSQIQVRVLQRLYRICHALRSECATEPCLEQYENRIQLLMDDRITPATTAWIEIIAQSLRTNTEFRPAEYIRM